MLNKKKLLALITAVSVTVGTIMPLKIVDAEEIDANQTEGVQEEASNKVIEVLSFNDFHGSLLENGKEIGGAKLAGVIKEYQDKDKESDTYGVVTVAGGDNYQGTAISNMLKGTPVNEMLKEIGIVASAVGNHEYDWGADTITSWSDEAGFKF